MKASIIAQKKEDPDGNKDSSDSDSITTFACQNLNDIDFFHDASSSESVCQEFINSDVEDICKHLVFPDEAPCALGT